jgi:hypothetical protein
VSVSTTGLDRPLGTGVSSGASWIHRLRLVRLRYETVHGVLQEVGRQMGVSHCHGDALVP